MCHLPRLRGRSPRADTIIGVFGAFIPAAAIGCLGGILAIGAGRHSGRQLLIATLMAIMAVA